MLFFAFFEFVGSLTLLIGSLIVFGVILKLGHTLVLFSLLIVLISQRYRIRLEKEVIYCNSRLADLQTSQDILDRLDNHLANGTLRKSK